MLFDSTACYAAWPSFDVLYVKFKRPQFGHCIRLSLPAAFVTSDEKTPATPKSMRFKRARAASGSVRIHGFNVCLRQHHVSCKSCHDAPMDYLSCKVWSAADGEDRLDIHVWPDFDTVRRSLSSVWRHRRQRRI